MKRPEQHITETKSQRIFEGIVPAEWVCREIKPDYGIDYLVEIFDNNESTGKTFFVQLKGSTQEIKEDTFEKQLPTDSLKYYSSLALPVLIVCVSVNTKQVWGVWANKLIEQKSVKDNQKTISLKLDRQYLLDHDRFASLTSLTDVQDKLGLFVEADSKLANDFNAHILRWIKHYYSKSVSVKFNHLPRHFRLEYTTKKSVQLSIDTNSYSKTVKIEGLNENMPFLYRPMFDSNEINDQNKEVLLSIAVGLAKYDIKGSLDLLTNLCGKMDFSEQYYWTELDPLGLLEISIREGAVLYFNRFVRQLIEQGYHEMFLFFDLAYFVLETDELRELRVENLLAVIRITEDRQIQGTCHYNIGNIFRATRGNAIEHYFKAYKLFPDYQNRSYWWKEVAGLLFEKGHHNWAENCYRKSLKIKEEGNKNYFRLEKKSVNEDQLVRALIADCLFLQGRFGAASDLFEDYVLTAESSFQEWELKNIVCIELKNGELDNVAFDRRASLELCKESLSIVDSKKIIAVLTKALGLYPTNGLAWFNLGVALDKEKMLDQALFAFLMAGLIQDNDKEAQFNALTISFTTKNVKFLQAILGYIYEKHGVTVLNSLSDYIMLKDIPLQSRKELVKVFSEMIELLSSKRKMFRDAVRALGGHFISYNFGWVL